jgi:putative tryptophan/tyrosine transport system substrate-binding protein
MRRRDFLGVLGGATAWPHMVRAQQPGKMQTVGFLVGGTPSSHGRLVAAFAERLRELGWTEGRTVALEVRWAEGRYERFAEIAAELVRLRVDVIVTSGAAVVAVKGATPSIPIVFAGSGDPLGIGLVASLARPGGNVTGISMQQVDITSKRLDILRELVPGLGRLAILANIDSPNAILEMKEVAAAARKLGLEVVTSEIRQAADIAPALDALEGRADALYICPDALMTTNSIRINTLALGARLPTTYLFREDIVAGGLMSYGPNLSEIYRRTADYVDKIMRGTNPADIPVEQPTKFSLVVNLITAKALRLTVPRSLIARADEVIE